jgi:hypothetical protein
LEVHNERLVPKRAEEHRQERVQGEVSVHDIGLAPGVARRLSELPQPEGERL